METRIRPPGLKVWALGTYGQEMIRARCGTAAFLAAQAQTFDRELARPTPAFLSLAGVVMLTGAAARAYELIATATFAAMKARESS